MPATRTQGSTAATSPSPRTSRHSSRLSSKDEKGNTLDLESDFDEDEPETPQKAIYEVDGVEYESYEAMAKAKRERNQQKLKELGLFNNPALKFEDAAAAKKKASQRGIKRKSEPAVPLTRRKSNRVAGISTGHVALDYNVNWNKDFSTYTVEEGDGTTKIEEPEKEPEPKYYKGRVNNGGDLSISDSIQLLESKWIHDESEDAATKFCQDMAKVADETSKSSPSKRKQSSPTSVAANIDSKNLEAKFDALSIDNEEWVAKVVPDRIYSVAAHPSVSKLIVGAGDKQGYMGLWDVDAGSASLGKDGVYLFRPHTRPISTMEWTSPSTLITSSYDSSVRSFDVHTGTFREIFATYDDDEEYSDKLGFSIDTGYRFWVQSMAVDHRNSYARSDPCLFLATSTGKAIHVDLRSQENRQITFSAPLSEKKINSLSLHPNGYTLASGGLDCTLNLWDIRKFATGTKSKKSPKPFATQVYKKSINSAFFSPSGNSLLSTTMTDRLDLIDQAHTLTGKLKPTYSISHNNQTGRWLTTFMAQWHPSLDVFVSGSMNKPRCVQAFDAKSDMLCEAQGEALSSVMSRCCFHPSTEKLVMIGGNSSGRVVAIR